MTSRGTFIASSSAALASIAVIVFTSPRMSIYVMTLHYVAFALTAWGCLGDLARLRPPAAYAAEFWFWSGCVAGLAAWLVLDLWISSFSHQVIEYPIALIAGCLIRFPLTRGEPKDVAV